MGDRAGLHGARRAHADAQRLLRARARRGLRRGHDPPARAHAPGPEGGPAASHARDAGQPVADLLAVLRPRPRRLARARAGDTAGEPFAEVTEADGTHNRVWRIADPEAITTVQGAIADAELLIADGHHRYETARVYADEIGGEGAHRYVLMCLVALQDEGLTVFPTHRLVTDLKGNDEKIEALTATLRAAFEIELLESPDDLVPPGEGDGTIQMGYMDSHFKRPFRLTLKDQAIADEALADMPEPYRRLDTAVLEALVLTGPLGLSEDDISHLNGLGYARSFEEARELVDTGAFDAGFYLRGIPVAQIQEIAAAGVNMPPKSTYFFPKVPTGLLFNPLSDPE